MHRVMVKTKLAVVLYATLALLMASCGNYTSSGTQTGTPPQTQPIISVSVASAREPGGLVNPGGPELMVTLKNNSTEPIVALSAFLSISSIMNTPYTFDFGITS